MSESAGTFRFTDFVLGLSATQSPDPETFKNALAALRRILVFEMRRRSLWQSSPSFLGVLGGESWRQPGMLDELVLDCYEFVFLRRLPGLLRRAAQGEIEGLIFLNVQHFLHDVQRRHDPLGYRVFEVVKCAVTRLIEDAKLHLIAGDSRIRNDTVLGFEPWIEAEAEQLPPESVQEWNDTLMPDLVTSWRRDQVVAAIYERIVSLAKRGVPAFYFRDVVTPLKEDARSRWLTMLFEETPHEVDEESDAPQAKILEMPRHAFEDRDAAEYLLSCIARGIEQSQWNRKTREYLRRLLDYFWQSTALDEVDSDEKAQSDRFISKLLGIPRARVTELTSALGELANVCRRSAVSGDGAGAGAKGGGFKASGPGTQEVTAMNIEDRMERLRGETQAAMARAHQGALGDDVKEGPKSGDVISFMAAREPVDWLVLDAVGEEIQMIAVDDFPLIGSRDTDLGAPRVARGHHVLQVKATLGERATRVESLGAEVLEAIRQRLEGEPPPTLFDQQIDEDSEYLGWMERLRAAGARLSEDGATTSLGIAEADIPHPSPAQVLETQESANVVKFEPKPVPTSRSATSWPRSAILVAASLTFALVGLVGYLVKSSQVSGLDVTLVEYGEYYVELNAGAVRSGSEKPWQITKKGQIVYLQLDNATPKLGYRVRILDPDRKVLWMSQVLPRKEHAFLFKDLGNVEEFLIEVEGMDEDGNFTFLKSFALTTADVESEFSF